MKVNGSGTKEHRKSILANLYPLCYNIEVIAKAAIIPECGGKEGLFPLIANKGVNRYGKDLFQRTEKCLDPFL